MDLLELWQSYFCKYCCVEDNIILMPNCVNISKAVGVNVTLVSLFKVCALFYFVLRSFLHSLF